MDNRSPYFRIENHESYVWTRVPDGGRFIRVYKHRKAWTVFDGDKKVYGGFTQGSNTRSQNAICPTKKAAKAWIEGYFAGKELGEFPALRKSGEFGTENPSYQNGVYSAIR